MSLASCWELQYKVESLGDWAYIYSREGVTTVNTDYVFRCASISWFDDRPWLTDWLTDGLTDRNKTQISDISKQSQQQQQQWVSSLKNSFNQWWVQIFQYWNKMTLEYYLYLYSCYFRNTNIFGYLFGKYVASKYILIFIQYIIWHPNIFG